jgi:ferredoxin-NADP reductase
MAEASERRPGYRATLTRVHEHHPGTRSLFLRLPSGRLPFMPGQFLSCEIPVADGAPLVRPYSIASSPEDDELEICVDRVANGPGSAHLFALRPGDELAFTGPFGSFALPDPVPDVPLVFIGEGTGIAPLRPMVRRALQRGGTQPITVLQGARWDHELVYRDELEAWTASHPRFHWEHVLLTTEAEIGPIDALGELALERFVRDDQDRSRRFWICTVGPMAGRLRDALRAAGYERRNVRAEEW